MTHYLQTYWWVIVLVLCLVLYKFILRFLFGMVIVPEDRIGLVTKKFVLFGANKELPDGRIVATNGEAGFKLKPWHRDCISECGSGNMKSPWNSLRLFRKERSAWFFPRMVQKSQRGISWVEKWNVTTSRMRTCS